MKIGSAFGVPILLHPLLPVMMVVAVAMGQLGAMCILSAGLIVHECAHALAAHVLNVRVINVEFMPFGGVARIDSSFLLSPVKALLIAAAGPAASVAFACCATLPGWFGLISPDTVGSFLRVNLSLALFNLLPAAPLDGGRMLYALLSTRFGISRALKTVCIMGQSLAAIMAAASIFLWINGGLNLILPMAALYMYLGGRRDGRDSRSLMLRDLMLRRERMNARRVMRARVIATLPDVSLNEIVGALTPDMAHIIAIMDDGRRILGYASDVEVMSAYLSKPTERVVDLLK